MQLFRDVFMITYEHAVQGDRNEVNRALNNLKLWDIPQDEIDALRAEAKKISANKDAWFHTPEGRWVMRGTSHRGQGTQRRQDRSWQGTRRWQDRSWQGTQRQDGSWQGRGEPLGPGDLAFSIDGVVIEHNVHKDEMVVDNTVNLFQIADVSRLLVIANCPEDQLPTLEALDPQRQEVDRANGGRGLGRGTFRNHR